MNLSDAFSWPTQSGEEETEEDRGLEMKLDRAKKENPSTPTAAQDLISAIVETAEVTEEDVPRL